MGLGLVGIVDFDCCVIGDLADDVLVVPEVTGGVETILPQHLPLLRQLRHRRPGVSDSVIQRLLHRDHLINSLLIKRPGWCSGYGWLFFLCRSCSDRYAQEFHWLSYHRLAVGDVRQIQKRS